MISRSTDLTAQRNVRLALKSLLYQIKEEDGYFTTMEKVYDDLPANPDEVQHRVAACPILGYEKTERFNNETSVFLMLAYLLVYVKPKGSATEAIENVTADIQHLLGNNSQLPDKNGVPTCQIAWYFSAEPFGKVLDRAQAGVKIGVKIVYEHYHTDPTLR